MPARPEAINSTSLDKPLHMLPVGGQQAWSVQFDHLSKLVLELETDGGVVGLGEFYRDADQGRVAAIAAELLGKDISKLCLQQLPLPECREYDGFECAIWDAFAKHLNAPLYTLLGGAVRTRVHVGAWSSHRTAADAGKVARAFQEQGYTSIKFKADLDDDIAGICRAVAADAPSMKIIFDPNQRWENFSAAKRILRDLEAVGNVLLVEDPIPKWMMNDYADLRRMTPIAVVQHVALPYVYQGQRIHDVVALLEHRAVDGFNINAGFAKFQQMAGIISAAGLYCFHGSEVDLGILEAMYLHQAAAANCCVWPSDIFGRMIREHDLLMEPLRFEPPYAFVPDGVGLGVALDRRALQNYSQSKKVVG